MMIDREEIKKVLPHREPFALVDEITACVPGESAEGVWHLTEDYPVFKGHFPGYPVTPGVLMIEMLAQAGAVCMLLKPEFKGKVGLFGGIDKAKFRRQVVPGDVLDLEVEMIRQRGPVGTGKALASVGGEKAVSCEITFIVADNK